MEGPRDGLLLLPELIRFFFRRRRQEGDPRAVAGEPSPLTVGGLVDRVAAERLHEEGGVPIVGILGVRHPTTVG